MTSGIILPGQTSTANPIQYFESYQIKALLAAPDEKTRTGRRNQMMLILYYDTAARISELLVHGDPFLDGLIVVFDNGTIRQVER